MLGCSLRGRGQVLEVLDQLPVDNDPRPGLALKPGEMASTLDLVAESEAPTPPPQCTWRSY